MKTQDNKIENDNLAAIGIGAMIVFIALILVAAVAAAVIIQTAEKLQQNAQSTGDDTTDEMSGKVQILNVFVDDSSDSYVVYFRLAAGSDDTAVGDILWQVFCEDPEDPGPPLVAAATDRLAGDFTDSATPPVSKVFALDAVPVGAAPLVPAATVEAGKGYRVSLDVDNTNDAVAGTDDCGPDHLFTNGIKASLYIHVVGGGSTYDVLSVNDDSRGSVVV
jgi:flagellin FlaB